MKFYQTTILENYEFKLDSADNFDLKLKKESTEKPDQNPVDKRSSLLKELESKKIVVPLKIEYENKGVVDRQIRVNFQPLKVFRLNIQFGIKIQSKLEIENDSKQISYILIIDLGKLNK